jgi:anti-sigma factor ChrR (cupin superfamily)
MRTLALVGSALSFAAVFCVPPRSVAQDHAVGIATPENLKWGDAPAVLPKGAQFAVLAGDPTKAGPFTIRLKIPAGYKIPAHSHPTAEAVTVISGEMSVGMGEKLDEANAHKMPMGAFVDLPADMNHFAFSTAGAILQINSTGPFAIKYVNPADDPSRS